MKIKAILFGSTGMIGKGVLLECIDNSDVESVLLINRKTCGISHPKIREITHSDLSDLSSLQNEFRNYNACFFCLGISAVGLSENEYRKTTFDITVNTAKTLLSVNSDIVFCYVSGAGTNENGKMMWARVKGETENTLLEMSFRKTYLFRPGYIQPLKGIRSRTRLYNLIYFFFKPFYFLLKPFKGIVTDTTSLGNAMINCVRYGYAKNILESADINTLAKYAAV